jgi:hypothetical protein
VPIPKLFRATILQLLSYQQLLAMFLRSGAPAWRDQAGRNLAWPGRRLHTGKSSGSGSRPELQWCFQTRIEAWSQAPCTKQWLQSETPPQTDSDQKSTFLCAVWPFARAKEEARCQKQSSPWRRARHSPRWLEANGPGSGRRPGIRCFSRMRQASI